MPEVNLPRVSVVIANHNYGQWIGEAMRSVDAQRDYPYKRIIVIDDGSTDNSWEVIKFAAGLRLPSQPDFAKKNVAYTGKVGQTPVIAYRFNEAGGPSRARNLGIRLGWQHTDVFGFLDADDIYLPGKISKSVSKIMEDPTRIGGVYTDYDTLNETTGVLIREFKPPFEREKLLRECMIHSACIVTKMALEKGGLYDEELRVAEDFDLWLRITEHFLILHVPQCLMRVRVGSHQSSSTVRKEIWQKCWQRVMQKTQERAARAVHP